MPEQPRKPKSQFEISSQGNDIQGNDLGRELQHNRALDVRRDNDNVKDYTVKLKDIDSAILYYLENVVLPNINNNGQSFKIPIIYGSPERWKSVREDGYYKDKDGKNQVPLIMFRRTGMSKNRDLTNKVDANSPHLYQTFTKQWSKKNAYIPFSVLNNITPAKEHYNVIVPDYVNLTYEFVIWTDFVEQMNNLIEAINYSDGAYWGEPERFKFRSRIDDYSNITELNADTDRIVRTTFTLNLAGYIITDSINKAIANRTPKTFSPFAIRFTQEVTGTVDTSYTTGQVASRGASSTGGTASAPNTISNSVVSLGELMIELDYLGLNITKNSDSISGTDTAIFNSASIAVAPYPLPTTSKDNFSVFINGQLISVSSIVSITQIGNTVEIKFDTTSLGFNLDSNDTIIAIGKFNPTSDISL